METCSIRCCASCCTFSNGIVRRRVGPGSMRHSKMPYGGVFMMMPMMRWRGHDDGTRRSTKVLSTEQRSDPRQAGIGELRCVSGQADDQVDATITQAPHCA